MGNLDYRDKDPRNVNVSRQMTIDRQPITLWEIKDG
jgi:hypothetical protein